MSPISIGMLSLAGPTGLRVYRLIGNGHDTTGNTDGYPGAITNPLGIAAGRQLFVGTGEVFLIADNDWDSGPNSRVRRVTVPLPDVGAPLAGRVKALDMGGDGLAYDVAVDTTTNVLASRQVNFYVADAGANCIYGVHILGDFGADAIVAPSVSPIASFHGAGPGTTDVAVGGDLSTARFQYPGGLAVASNGDIWVADKFNHRMRVIRTGDPSLRSVRTVGSGVNGTFDGIPGGIQQPVGVAVAPAVNGVRPTTVEVYVTQFFCIRAINVATGFIRTVAGNPGVQGYRDGTGSVARFNFCGHPDVGADGNIYVPDQGNNCIRKVTPAGVVTTYAGDPTYSYHGEAAQSSYSLTSAPLVSPVGVAWDADFTHLYVSQADSTISVISATPPSF